MKTSNKIILAIIIVPLLVVTLVNITVYAKYKAGDMVSAGSADDKRYTRTSFQNIRHIAIYALNNCRIVPSDSLLLQIQKEASGSLRYEVHGDSLVIHGEPQNGSGRGIEPGERNFQDVKLFVPLMASILVDNSSVELSGNADSAKAASYVFSVVNRGSIQVRNSEKLVYFKGLSIQASKANGIELTAETRVEDLQLSIVGGEFADNGASIQQLTIHADKESRLSLTGDNLQRVNNVPSPDSGRK